MTRWLSTLFDLAVVLLATGRGSPRHRDVADDRQIRVVIDGLAHTNPEPQLVREALA